MGGTPSEAGGAARPLFFHRPENTLRDRVDRPPILHYRVEIIAPFQCIELRTQEGWGEEMETGAGVQPLPKLGFPDFEEDKAQGRLGRPQAIAVGTLEGGASYDQRRLFRSDGPAQGREPTFAILIGERLTQPHLFTIRFRVEVVRIEESRLPLRREMTAHGGLSASGDPCDNPFHSVGRRTGVSCSSM